MIKVKELKDDAILDIKVNKSFYLMAKAASFTILQQITAGEKGEEGLKEITTKKYEDLDDMQRTFYTLVLVLAEIERQATELNLYNEKEISEPGEENYKEPTQS
jgi:hypothetical protein